MSYLLQHINTDLLRLQNTNNSNITHHFEPYKVLVLYKKDVLYVTDGSVIVQAEMSKYSNKMDNKLKPFNIIRTCYYNFETRLANVFIFNEDDEESIQIPHVYHPLFHFKQDRIPDYRMRNRPNVRLQFEHCMNVLLLKQWGIRIVNVANTGYYGVIIQIFEFQHLNEKYPIHDHVHSILYQKSISSILQNMRIKHMRQLIGKPKQQNSISLFYYRKNTKSNRNNINYSSSFINADKNGKIVKVNPKYRQYYIPLGRINGVQRFLRPLKNFSQNKQTVINFNLFKSHDNQQASSVQEIQSETDQNSSNQQNSIDLQKTDSQDNSDQEEPLKLIYMKQLSKINLI